MYKSLLAAVLAALLAGCHAGNLGLYFYPQASSTGVTEIDPRQPLGGLEVVGYLPSNKIPRIDVSQVKHLTHLVYFSLGVRTDGTVNRSGLLATHRSFLQKAKSFYGVKVLVAIADHKADGPLSVVADDPTLRERFAQDLAQFLVSEGFDGADFDWEYPSAEQQNQYALLLNAVHERFTSSQLRLSVAVSPSKPLTALAYASVDRIHGMLYDDFGRHSTLEKVAVHVRQMISQGADASKLLLGMPFYGRGYTASGPSWSSALSYKSLQERYKLDPDQDTASGYYFNGPETVRKKVEFAKSAGLPGVMIWEIGQDTTGEKSLLAAITQARRQISEAN